MCSPCGPMVCYKYEDCGPPKRSELEDEEESGSEKKGDKGKQLKRTKSRELRGGILYYSCDCIKRNGLQHECRRTGCGGEPPCLVLPEPVCAPSQRARARGLAPPLRVPGTAPAAATAAATKRFIVCELKATLPEVAPPQQQEKSADKCCKCCLKNIKPPICCKCPPKEPQSPKEPSSPQEPQPLKQPVDSYELIKEVFSNKLSQAPNVPPMKGTSCCNRSRKQSPPKLIDEGYVEMILEQFEKKDVKSDRSGGGGKGRGAGSAGECRRPGCLHWKPPAPCVWDQPCRADCFETHPGRHTEVINPPRDSEAQGEAPAPRTKYKLLTGSCVAGCGEVQGAPGAPAAGMPVLIMKML
ncbi:hypothetical protein JYU34_003833 [Plutella xylostella]|uniref:Uncharacterized protein n=1 Tax=Plutella xylostella TaxID=51655 RepID=A0ABQ7R107_PLUXY|nr:hypothetical protein JYU34_003833 [Plutella xylostella]